MIVHRGITAALLLAWFLVPCAWAQSIEDDRYHLSMQSPTDWQPMSAELLAQTNAQVNHFTGRGFVAGAMLNASDTLVFPYMLVQFKPYSTLPQAYRPKAKPSERDQLGVVYALVSAFREKGPLPDEIDAPQFTDQFGSKHAVLTRLDAEYGRFDFTGKIPHEQGQTPIEYHTHGVLGKDGIAIATVFTIEGFTGLNSVINNEMRTLAFGSGYTMDALADTPPADEPTQSPAAEPTEAPIEPGVPETATSEEPNETEPAAGAEAAPALADPGASAEPKNPSTGHADSGALIVILSLLGVVLITTALIAWLVAHKKAQAQREKRRARLERRQAAQASSQVQPMPRPTSPTTAQSPGSTGRRTREKSR